MAIRLVIFDCDRTLWHHEDVSSLELPFCKVNEETAADARGIPVRLFSGVREVLEALRRRGVVCSIASWNRPEPVLSILDLLDLRDFFTHPKVEFHPHKDRMVTALLAELRDEGMALRPEEILFVDDRARNLDTVRAAIGPIETLQPGVDFTNFREVLRRAAPVSPS